jgi:hypothetical protein
MRNITPLVAPEFWFPIHRRNPYYIGMFCIFRVPESAFFHVAHVAKFP